MAQPVLALLLVLLAGQAAAPAAAQPPVRRWLPTITFLPASRSVDWSRAGYQDGDAPLPVPSATYDVKKEFGAKGDGKTDDTKALRAAIAAANGKSGVVIMPAGVYRLSGPLEVTRSGVVLRGAGEDSTRIQIDTSLADIYKGSWSQNGTGHVRTRWAEVGGFITFRGAREWSGRNDTRLAALTAAVAPGATRIPVDATAGLARGLWLRLYASTAAQERQVSAKVAAVGAGWVELDRPVPFACGSSSSNGSWVGTVHRYAPTVVESGVEKLTIDFTGSGQYGVHASDRGFNAIFINSAANVWVQQVTVLNSDNALLLDRVDHASILDVTVGTTMPRWSANDTKWRREGHHAIAMAASHAVLVGRFDVSSRYYHDLSATDGSLLNVFSGGRALDLNTHHFGGAMANLYTDIDTGLGVRLFQSAGSGVAGQRTTWYNLRGPNGSTTGNSTAPAARAAQPAAAPRQGGKLGGKRALAAAEAARQLALPPCSYGRQLNFFGSWAGTTDKCARWLVAPLNSSMPTDLWAEQWFERGNQPAPIHGAHRPVAEAARSACQTYLSDINDALECFKLVYDHCIPGYTNRNAVPRDLLYHEPSVIQSLYRQASKGGDFGSPPRLPAQYSRLCVADPKRAGYGNCKKIKTGDYRIHVPGFNNLPGARCDHVTGQISFVKAHIDSKNRVEVYGRVGH